MSLQDPGTLTIICDECGEEQDFDTTGYCGSGKTTDSYGVDDQTVMDQDWTVDGDDHYCPECSKDRKDEP